MIYFRTKQKVGLNESNIKHPHYFDLTSYSSNLKESVLLARSCAVHVCNRAWVERVFGTVWRMFGNDDNISGGLGLAEQMVCMIRPYQLHETQQTQEQHTSWIICEHTPVSVDGLRCPLL